MSTTVVYLFQVKRSAIPFAFLQMAIGRRQARSIPGVSFAKLMGTGTGRTFTPSDADLRQWAILFVADDLAALDRTRFIARWRNRSTQESRYEMRPISSHGQWSKREPFEVSADSHGINSHSDGMVIAITRARLKWSQAIRFWRSIPPVVEDLHRAPGLKFSIGIGEAPIGLQGTFSIWESGAALRDFAYKNAPHREAIANTAKFNWYSEELFARFALVNATDFHHVD